MDGRLELLGQQVRRSEGSGGCLIRRRARRKGAGERRGEEGEEARGGEGRKGEVARVMRDSGQRRSGASTSEASLSVSRPRFVLGRTTQSVPRSRSSLAAEVIFSSVLVEVFKPRNCSGTIVWRKETDASSASERQVGLIGGRGRRTMTDSGRELDAEAIEQEGEDLEGMEPVREEHVLTVAEITRDLVVKVGNVHEVGDGRDSVGVPDGNDVFEFVSLRRGSEWTRRSASVELGETKKARD
jgi:hypothetical protein